MENERTGFFAWLQDNARILLSVALVLFLLFAVYSYSKRTDRTSSIVSDGDSVQLVALDENGNEDDAITSDIDTMLENTDKIISGDKTGGDTMADKKMAKETAPKVVIERKDGAVKVSAAAGEGLTHLARKAAADFTSSNNIETLSAEQKVYVEDYLRKAVDWQSVHPGTTVSFSNDLIATAIEKAHTLTPAQIANLSKYVQ